MIYKRFTEKAAEEWRQIYKALQLLEFLIKNGSERVIDDARSHLTLLKMLRQFHFIDANGKDQGINVRNRAKELTELLSDVERIRTERKKARTTRQKYTGVEGGAGMGGGMSSSSRFGGFGSEEQGGGGAGGDYGVYSGGVFGDGGGFGGQSSDFHDTGSRGSHGGGADRFDEYDEYDEGAVAAPGRRQVDAASSSRPRAGTERSTAKSKAPSPPAPKAPEVDLFSFDDPIPTNLSGAPATQLPTTADADDDFDDFQSAAPIPPTPLASLQSPIPATTSTTSSFTQFASPQPVSAPKQADLSSMMGVASISPAPSASSTPSNYSAFAPPAAAAQSLRPQLNSAYHGSQPNYFTSVKAPVPGAPASAGAAPSAQAFSKPAAKAGGDAFGSLWNSASAGVKKASAPAPGPALGQLAKEKAEAGMWGAPAATASAPAAQMGSSGAGNGLDDLLG